MIEKIILRRCDGAMLHDGPINPPVTAGQIKRAIEQHHEIRNLTTKRGVLYAQVQEKQL